MERRLTTIVAADMVGYSRLVEADEIGTLERQKVHRKELIDPTFEEFRGRIVKEMGDGLLVEFSSVVEAVRCAVKIQRAMTERETEVPEDRKIIYRVGINIGDIVVENDDIHGDGVNVASRLEAMAEPGGICISGTAFDHMRSAADVGYKSLGEVKLKNIERPIRAYEVLLDPDDAGTVVEDQKSNEPAEFDKLNFGLPQKQSIAVLPFDNLSGDPQQEYLGDSLTENIIAELATSPDLIVIARNSVFTFKGKPVKVQDVAEQLGVRYVLEGSVQTAGRKIRVVAQLVDAHDGKHLWAERYDYEIDDIFVVQDEISQKLAEELEVRLTRGGQVDEWRNLFPDHKYYKQFAQTRSALLTTSLEGHTFAENLVGKLDQELPDNVAVKSQLAWIEWQKAVFRFNSTLSSLEHLKRAYEFAEQANSLSETVSDPQLLCLLANIRLFMTDHSEAIRLSEKAMSLAPSSALVNTMIGMVLVHSGNPDLGVKMLSKGRRLDPLMNSSFNAIATSDGLLMLERYDEAEAICKGIISSKASKRIRVIALAHLAAVAIFRGKENEAKTYAKSCRALNPNISISGSALLLERTVDRRYVSKFLDALRHAGIPEN